MTPANHSPWPAVAVGAGLGALEWLSFVTAQQGLGITGAFETVAVAVQQPLPPARALMNRFIRDREEVPSVDWELALVAGVAAGGFFASRVSRSAGSHKKRPERAEALERRRYASAFVGGALMMLGARAAKGCTSGHGITGNAQLAASSLLFSVVMGATAIVAAHLFTKGT